MSIDSEVQSHSVQVTHKFPWVILIVILLGAFLRWSDLGTMKSMTYYDEAYYGADAISLIQQPRLTPFFPGNFGRESGWMYVLVPFIISFGAQAFAFRLAAGMVGVLTLAALYALAKELLGRRGAVWSTAALAVLYWHVHMNHIGWRANLLTLVGALTFASLLRAHRLNRWSQWVFTGVLIGLLTYTYFSARMWIAVAMLFLAIFFVFDAPRRQGSFLAGMIAVVLAVPMLVYLFTYPEQSLSRINDVAAFSVSGIAENIGLWLRAWFQQGDLALMPNIPGRPILDPFSGVLFLVGLIGVLLFIQQRWRKVLFLSVAFSALLPSLLSQDAPHFLRANGLTLVIALTIGAGALLIERVLVKRVGQTLITIVLAGLLVISGVITYRDFQRWLADPRVAIYMEEYINRPLDYLKLTAPVNRPIYVLPHSIEHPLIRFRAADLAPRPVRAFDTFFCQVTTDVPADYVTITAYEPNYSAALSRWADVQVITTGAPLADDGLQLDDVYGEINPSFRPPPTSQQDRGVLPFYTIYQATPHTEWVSGQNQPTAIFGDAVRLRSIQPIPATVHAGDNIAIQLGMTALTSLDKEVNIFIHLYASPLPSDGVKVWSVNDEPACAAYPAADWQPHEIVVQDFNLTIPADTPPGKYVIATGLYDRATAKRLPLTQPTSADQDFFRLQEINVIK
jgi:4-amino-4-deoxy-L-arabinose transferase-like glycosyltransferase